MKRNTKKWMGMILSGSGSILFLQSCIPASGVAFRDSALPAIENGVDLILDGIVDGVFAALTPEPNLDEG